MSNINALIASPHEILVDDAGNNKRIIYFTADIPIEIISAANFIPFRIPSDLQENEKQNNMTTVLQPFICSKSHQFFDFIIKHSTEIGGAIFSENHCDSLQNFLDVLNMKNSLPVGYPNFRYLLPTNRGGQAEVMYYFKEIKRLILWFEEWTGHEISYNNLSKAIMEHNKKRALLKSISSYLTYGINIEEYLRLKIATDLLPINHSIDLLSQINTILSDLNSGRKQNETSQPRILISGSMFDNYKLFSGIEILRNHTVGVDLSFISRTSEFQISETVKNENKNIDILLKNIAEAYVVKKIPDSVHHYPGRRKKYLSDKIDHLKINGVVFIYYSFCDPDAFEVRSMSRYLENEKGIATLTLVTDPQLTNLHQLTTRVEAFMEKIGEI